MQILLSNIDLQIYALLRVKFSGLKMCECKKMTNIRYGFWSADINTFRTESRYTKYILTSEIFSSSIWSRSLAWSIYPERGGATYPNIG